MTHDRSFDVVVLGATGFTGTLVAEYLARHANGARWAIAGRDAGKLRGIRERARALGGEAPEMIVADVADPASLVEMARRTKVVLTTVGPYVRYGEAVVRACIEAGTDVCDITGEATYVAMLVERYHAAAAAAKVRVVPCCGYDSIPADLGAQFAVEHLPADEDLCVRGYARVKGQASGGTWHSALGILEDLGATLRALDAIPRTGTDVDRRVEALPAMLHREDAVDAWGVPMPVVDGPIALRSAALVGGYGRSFRYGHFGASRRALAGLGMTLGLPALSLALRIPAVRARAGAVLQPGQGPSEATRSRSRFEVFFVGESAQGARVLTRVAGGDPGYTETSKMVAESALCLAMDRESLPARAGVLTTASAMGPVLRRRLVAAGLTFERLR